MKKYIYNGVVYKEENYDKMMRDIENELVVDSEFDEMLDLMYGEIDVCGHKHHASTLLKVADEVDYRCQKCDYSSAVFDNIKREIENLDEEDEYNGWQYGIFVECVADDKEAEEIDYA